MNLFFYKIAKWKSCKGIINMKLEFMTTYYYQVLRCDTSTIRSLWLCIKIESQSRKKTRIFHLMIITEHLWKAVPHSRVYSPLCLCPQDKELDFEIHLGKTTKHTHQQSLHNAENNYPKRRKKNTVGIKRRKGQFQSQGSNLMGEKAFEMGWDRSALYQ